jgi:hypothetical protein
MSSAEGFTPLNGSAGNSAPTGGRRGSRKLRLVKKKTVRRMLKKMGLKMRGGDPTGATADGAKLEVAKPAAAPAMGGRRHRSRSTRRRGRSLFGLRY